MCSGLRWITSAIFVECVHLFQEKVRANINHRVFVLLDNHSSPEATDASCERSINSITVQFNIRHKTQPVDLCAFNQLKWLRSYVPNKWIATNAERNLIQYQFCRLYGGAYRMSSAFWMQQTLWCHVAYGLPIQKFSEIRISTRPFYRSIRREENHEVSEDIETAWSHAEEEWSAQAMALQFCSSPIHSCSLSGMNHLISLGV
jgi:hypothetical protein